MSKHITKHINLLTPVVFKNEQSNAPSSQRRRAVCKAPDLASGGIATSQNQLSNPKQTWHVINKWVKEYMCQWTGQLSGQFGQCGHFLELAETLYIC